MGDRKQKTALWEARFAYGSGDAACNIVVGMISTILTMFYTDYIGIDPATIGIVMLVSRVLDGIGTLVMGVIAEKTNTKYGRYRPWILWTALPYAVSVILLFTVPKTTPFLQLIYVFVTYNLCTTVFYNALNVPYGSLAYVMTRDSSERNMLSMVRMCMASGGRLLAVCGTLPLVKLWGDGQSAWIKATILWAALAVGLLGFCFGKCRENVVIQARETQKKTPLIASMKSVLGNLYFWAGAGFQLMQYVLFAVTGTILSYYCKYVFGNDSWMYSLLYFLETMVLILCMVLCPMLMSRFGKRNTSIAGILLALLGHLLFLGHPTSFAWVTMSCIVRGIGFAPVNSVLFAFLGEAVEYGQWKTHLRQESLIYASSSVITKIGAGVAAAFMTTLLSVSGYVSVTADNVNPVQPDSAVQMIINIYKYGPLFILLVFLLILVFYKLEKKILIIMEELTEREAGGGM